MERNFNKELHSLRDGIIEAITVIIENAPDKIVRFRITPDDREDGPVGDQGDACEEDEVLFDLNIGERDADNCYPTVIHARIDLGRSVIVCCTGSYEDPEYCLSELSTDDLVGLYYGLVELTKKTFAVKLYYHGCLEVEVKASNEEEALLKARCEASSMPGDEFIAASALTDEDHDVTELDEAREADGWFRMTWPSFKTEITGIAQSDFPEEDDGSAFDEACFEKWKGYPEQVRIGLYHQYRDTEPIET